MKKFKILIPVYNDWQSLIKLLDEIGNSVEHIKNAKFDCLVINDASTIKLPKIQKPANLNSIKIIKPLKVLQKNMLRIQTDQKLLKIFIN